MAVLAHACPKEAARYTRKAERARLVESAFAHLAGPEGEQNLSNPIARLDKAAAQPTERKGKMRDMAIPGGLEPPTYCLEGSCSIQLSYGTAQPLFWARSGLRSRLGRVGYGQFGDPAGDAGGDGFAHAG